MSGSCDLNIWPERPYLFRPTLNLTFKYEENSSDFG